MIMSPGDIDSFERYLKGGVSRSRQLMAYIEVLQIEIEVLSSMLQPHDTGHIHTTINMLKERIKELEVELQPPSK